MKFKTEFLKEELDLPYNAVEDEVVDNGRRGIQHEIVFEYNGKHYSTYYSVGATELQDESPWEYEEEVECIEVEPKEVTVKKWVAVK